MKRIRTYLCLSLFGSLMLSIELKAQVSTEFEGLITYTHQVVAIDNEYDVEKDYGYIGRRSDFYYKSGKYKWLNENAFIEMDMFRNKDSIEFLKMQSTDTILYVRNNFSNETVVDYKIILNADTVLGHICKVLVIKATQNGNEWTRKYSFSDKFPVNASLFEKYKYNSTNTIYSLMKAIPLKIELIYPNRKIIYTAIKIENKSLNDSLFEFGPGTKFKSLM